MAFVRTIPPSAAEGAVREMYEDTIASSASTFNNPSRLCGRR